MSNVLAEDKLQQVLALGRLGWSLRRIERATGVRRETASGYLKAAGEVVRGRGRPAERPAKPAISSEVSADSSRAPSADSSRAPSAGTGTGDAAPASGDRPSRAPQASACEPYRELIAEAVGRGRNAMAIWQDLVDDHGFPAGYASVRRFVSTLRQQPTVEARAVITTGPAEDYADPRVMLSLEGEADQEVSCPPRGRLALHIIPTGNRASRGGPWRADEAWALPGLGCRRGPRLRASSRGRSGRRPPWTSRRRDPGSP